MPAVLIVDAQHIVRRIDVRQDYTSPVEVRDIFAALKRSAESVRSPA